jgi:DNA-binding MarR family transcriptional regulator
MSGCPRLHYNVMQMSGSTEADSLDEATEADGGRALEGGLSRGSFARALELRLALRRFSAESDAAIRAHGLTTTRYELLLLVKALDPSSASVGGLAEPLSIGQSAASRLVQRCENEGLLERGASPVDARVQQLRLTADGERRLTAVLVALGPERSRLISEMSKLG